MKLLHATCQLLHITVEQSKKYIMGMPIQLDTLTTNISTMNGLV